MFKVMNFDNNDDVNIIDQKGPFKVIEYERDLSVNNPHEAIVSYFSSKMNIKKRQVICDLSQAPITLQSGAMQWSVGDVNATTGIKGVGDLIGKAFRGKATGESAIKPEYQGNGLLITEPTFKHPIILDLNQWGGAIVLNDGLFLACDGRIKHKAVFVGSASATVAGNEGLFNLGLEGDGYAVIESNCPLQELIQINLKDDQIKIDGNYAVAWSKTLNFTVERSGKTLVGSAASGEGLVNVYRGTGMVLMMPV